MLERFNEIYNLPENTPFRRVELEDAVIEKFGDLHYNKYEDTFKNREFSIRYFMGCKNNWGIYDLSSSSPGKSAEEALMLFFIKYGVEPKEGTEEYYTENVADDVHEIVKKVYKNAINS